MMYRPVSPDHRETVTADGGHDARHIMAQPLAHDDVLTGVSSSRSMSLSETGSGGLEIAPRRIEAMPLRESPRTS
jgi:hypothetical protein